MVDKNFSEQNFDGMPPEQLKTLLEAMAKGELSSELTAKLEKHFGAKKLVMLTVENVEPKFFSSKMFKYMIDIREDLPVEIIVKFWSQARFNDKFTALKRYAKVIPLEQLIAFAVELVSVADDEHPVRNEFVFEEDYAHSARLVGEIFREAFDEKTFIDLVTECAFWSIEHDALTMQFATMPIEREISSPRKWAHFIFNAPEKFPIELIMELYPYAWLHDQMTVTEKRFDEFPSDWRRQFGWELVKTPLTREELQSFTTTRLRDTMEMNEEFETRQARLKERLKLGEKTIIDLIDLPREELFAELASRIDYSIEPSELASELGKRFNTFGLIDFVMEFHNWTDDERTQRACAAIVFNSPSKFPRSLLFKLLPFASSDEMFNEFEQRFDNYGREQLIILANGLIGTKFARRMIEILRSKMHGEELADFIWNCKVQSYEAEPHWEKFYNFDDESFIEHIFEEHRQLTNSLEGSDSNQTIGSNESK